MKVLLTGGGTGGHITPLLSVAHELKSHSKDTRIIYVGERHGKFAHLTDGHHHIDEAYSVFSGKFRRYHKQSWLIRLFSVRTNILNLRDAFFVFIGVIQAWLLLGRIKPDVIFLKGGYVGVPVGLAAALRKIPFVTHDSDAKAGLANRIVGRWAKVHATAMAPKFYNYEPKKIIHVGVIVSTNYKPVNENLQRSYKKQLGIPENEQLLVITGGSLGAKRLNKAVSKFIVGLLDDYPNLHVIHQVGKAKIELFKDIKHPNLQFLEFFSDMHVYMGAADIVVTRAGANTLAELGVQAKACIVVPNPDLTGGHQLKNARILDELGVAIIVYENDMNTKLESTIRTLLKDAKKAKRLGQKLSAVTLPDAGKKVAQILISLSTKNEA